MGAKHSRRRLPSFSAPARVIEGLNYPWGIAVREGGEVVVSEWTSNRVSIISASGEKKSFEVNGSAFGLNWLGGVAIDGGGNILVVDNGSRCIQQFLPSGTHLKTIATSHGRQKWPFNEPLQFHNPQGIAVHPHTHKVYVADCGNCRIQILNSDLTYCSSFHEVLSSPLAIAVDSEGNVYVVDSDSHKVHVFTADGVYLRDFGRKGEGQGELKSPVSIAIDSKHVVYVGDNGNSRISIFSTDGKFIKSFGQKGSGAVKFKGPYGLAVDESGTVYVCDTFNNRIQMFT